MTDISYQTEHIHAAPGVEHYTETLARLPDAAAKLAWILEAVEKVKQVTVLGVDVPVELLREIAAALESETALRLKFDHYAGTLDRRVRELETEHARACEILRGVKHGKTRTTLCQLAHNAVACASGRKRRILSLAQRLEEKSSSVEVQP